MKMCNKCHVEKSLDLFNKRSSSKDGRQGTCRECARQINSARYLEKGDLIKLKVKERAARIGTKNIYEANRDWYQAYYQKNRDKILARTKVYAKANKEQRRATKARRKSRTIKAMSKMDRLKSVRYRKLIAGNPCYYCGSYSNFMHDDHYYPLAKGGTDHWFNIVRACSECNWKKNARLASTL